MRAVALLFLLILAGCGEGRITDPPRTATEQFIISTAAEGAVEKITLTPLAGHRIYVDATRLLAEDPQRNERQYMAAMLRQALLQSGGKLVNERDAADIIVELRSGGLSIDQYAFFIGIPGELLGPAVSGTAAGPLYVPQKDIALVRNARQWGFGGLTLLAYWRESGDLLTFAGPHVGTSHVERWRFFLLGGRTVSDVPTTVAPQE